MRDLAVRIGERIRQLRIEAHLTQNELSSGVVTRNMLSMIESGRTMPSVDTLVELSKRLGVAPGYIFADSGEELLYRKEAVIDRIRSAFSARRCADVITLSEGLEDDEEISFYAAFSHLDLGMDAFRKALPGVFEFHLEYAVGFAQGKTYYSYVKNTLALARLLCEHAGERRVSEVLCDPAGFTPCAFPYELFVYLSAMSFIENGDVASADALLRSGMLVSDGYRYHVEGAVLEGREESESALEAFIKAAQAESPGFYSTLKLYTDIELCAQKLGDYKLAYDYSTKHIALIESIRK